MIIINTRIPLESVSDNEDSYNELHFTSTSKSDNVNFAVVDALGKKVVFNEFLKLDDLVKAVEGLKLARKHKG